MTYRIPSLYCREAIGSTPGIVPGLDVIEGGRGGRVDQGIQEPEDGLAGSDQVRIDEGNNSCERGSGAAGAIDQPICTIDNDAEVRSGESDVRERTTRSVELAIISVANLLQVALYGDVLV